MWSFDYGGSTGEGAIQPVPSDADPEIVRRHSGKSGRQPVFAGEKPRIAEHRTKSSQGRTRRDGIRQNARTAFSNTVSGELTGSLNGTPLNDDPFPLLSTAGVHRPSQTRPLSSSDAVHRRQHTVSSSIEKVVIVKGSTWRPSLSLFSCDRLRTWPSIERLYRC
jgi:hypothetical protein